MQEASQTYQKFAEYYDLYVGSFDYDLNIYLSFCKKNDAILEVGCGTGRVLEAFLNKNYSITGVDISDEMLLKAKEKYSAFIDNGMLNIHNHDFYKSALKSKYSKVLITFFTFNYIIDNPALFLQNIYQSMQNEASLIMDVFVPTKNTQKDFWHESTLKSNGREIKVFDNRFLENNLEYRSQIYIEDGIETRIETRRKYFSPEEIGKLLAECGFHQIEFSGTYDISKFGSEIDESKLDRHFLIKAKK